MASYYLPRNTLYLSTIVLLLVWNSTLYQSGTPCINERHVQRRNIRETTSRYFDRSLFNVLEENVQDYEENEDVVKTGKPKINYSVYIIYRLK